MSKRPYQKKTLKDLGPGVIQTHAIAETPLPLEKKYDPNSGGKGGRFGEAELEKAREFLMRTLESAISGRSTRQVTAAVQAAKGILEHSRWSQERDDDTWADKLAEMLGDDESALEWLENRLVEVRARITARSGHPANQSH